jgi:hypothetical protein
VPMFDPTGAQGAFLAGRIAYFFDLHGPALGLDTACSSSMQALHVAVQSIRSGESETALVGASHLITQPDVWVSMAKLRLFSEAGKTHAFDHRAKSGYARGEGVGCLVLKPLHQAMADNDHIWAVIAETGISHNGRTVGRWPPLFATYTYLFLCYLGGQYPAQFIALDVLTRRPADYRHCRPEFRRAREADSRCPEAVGYQPARHRLL